MIWVRRALVLALAFGWSAPLPAESPAHPCHCLSLTAWTTKDGLPSSNIMAIAQDRQGYLWLGMNGGGLVRFDGSQFTPWGVGGEDALPGDFIPALLGARDGSLWVGFGHRPGLQQGAVVSHIVGRTVTSYTVNDGLAGGMISAIVED